MEFPIRINKYLRDSALASRREADKLVEAGLVFINGKRAESGQMVNSGDKVFLKENKNNKKVLQYFAYYKPRGLATQDLPGIKSVISEWKKEKVYPIGRLDKESEGLLILTNDGRLAREVLSEKDKSEKDKWEKEYVVSVRETLTKNVVKIMQQGMTTKVLGKLLPAKARIINNNRISIILNEGKRHQIRVMLEELGYTVNSLKRVRIGNIKMGLLKPGESRKISVKI